MLELLLCSLLTIFPDYLYRRYHQGKRIGKEINLFSVWFELRWGIVSCLMLTVALITVIFYYHPTTSNVTSFFRAVPISPETNGRVAEIFVSVSSRVEKGAPIFRLDSSQQEAAVETARRRSAEIEAAMVVAQTDLLAADAQIQQAKSAYQQALEELQTKTELNRAMPILSRAATLSVCKISWMAGRRGSMLQMPEKMLLRPSFRRCCRPRKRVPRLPSLRPRST